MSFTLIDIVLLIILSQGLFLTLAIQLVPNRNKPANQILTYLLIIASTMLFGRIALYRLQFDHLLRIATLVDTTLFLFGPLLYSYIRRLTFQEDKVYQLKRIHFLPAIIYLCYFLWTFTMNTNEFNTNYNNGYLNIAFTLIELSGLISISFYTYKCFRLYRGFQKNLKNQISYNQGITRYISFLIVALSVFIMLWTYSYISYYIFGDYNVYLNYNTMWLSTSIFMYLIGFYSLTQPQIFRIRIEQSEFNKTEKGISDSEEREVKTSKKNRISAQEVERLKNELHRLINDEKVFLIPELNLNQLAKRADTSANNLSWYLNQVLNKSFYEYINTFRINEFLRLVSEGESKSKTLLAIALESGFNTKSTFNSSFKTIMKDTPNNYIKTHIIKSKRTHPVD